MAGDLSGGPDARYSTGFGWCGVADQCVGLSSSDQAMGRLNPKPPVKDSIHAVDRRPGTAQGHPRNRQPVTGGGTSGQGAVDRVLCGAATGGAFRCVAVRPPPLPLATDSGGRVAGQRSGAADAGRLAPDPTGAASGQWLGEPPVDRHRRTAGVRDPDPGDRRVRRAAIRRTAAHHPGGPHRRLGSPARRPGGPGHRRHQ
ncbi:hypothetical protein D3C84_874180 [compost metagenome]